MHLTARLALITTIAVVPLATSCSSSPTPTPTPDTGVVSPASVAWVDGVCGKVRPFVEAAAAGPQIGGSDATAAVKGLSDYFGKATTAIDGTISGLTATSTAPVTGGDEVLKKMIGTYTAYRTGLQDAKSKVDAIDLSNPQSLASALPAAVQGLPATLDPVADLKANPDLGRAVEQSATCKALPAVGTS